MHRVLALGLVLLVLGCGDDDFVLFDGGSADALMDAGVGDALLDAAPDQDVGPPPPVSGVVRFERRALSARGLEGPVLEGAEGVEVLLFEGDTQVGLTTTAEDGSYGFDVEPSAAASVRVLASGRGIEVSDFRGNVYAYETSVVDGRADVEVTLADFAGALAIHDTLNEGLRFATLAFERPNAFPELTTFWERGRITPGGTSYAAGDELWILGGPSDTDEFDTPVLMHELGHYLQWVYDFYDVVPGDFHAGADTDARLAWGEGWASFFSSAARGTGFYGDSIGNDLAYGLDLERLPRRGEYVCNPAGGVTQTLSEWVISASLYELYRTGDGDEQRRRSFAPIRDWLSMDVSDRGLPGIDFVDFLDAYLCYAGGAQDMLVEQVVVDGRRFPHDLNPPCTKPGDRPGLQRFLRAPAAVPLPGRVIADAFGRTFRVIRI